MDKKLFSDRLRELRLKRGYKTQYALAKAYNERFGAKRKDEAGGNEKEFGGILGTIKNYENDSHKGSPKLEIVCNLCEMLGCDVSYLVGDYDERDYPTHKICEATGLSETAVSILINKNERAKREKAAGWVNVPVQQELDAVNALIEIDFNVLYHIYQYIYGDYGAFELPSMSDGNGSSTKVSDILLTSENNGVSEGIIVAAKDLQPVFMMGIQDDLKNIRQIIKGR